MSRQEDYNEAFDAGAQSVRRNSYPITAYERVLLLNALQNMVIDFELSSRVPAHLTAQMIAHTRELSERIERAASITVETKGR
jgi:hypothetical protein